ncbi:MAG: glycosidase [Planctomycetes bacterium]|nr:glycosidase [Planctomycetota bacterium]
MNIEGFQGRVRKLFRDHKELLNRKNEVDPTWYNGVFERYLHPVVTAKHTPLFWRYDLNYATNPLLVERLPVNSVFNPGAIEIDGSICLMCRVEGADRKSFFAVAESRSGVDGFRFREEPVQIPEADESAVNLYDMRLTRHEDGWIYGVFCVERKDSLAPPGNTTRAMARCGIARTKDLKEWERLPDLETTSPQQRNAVLHPEFVDGKYGFYTRPQDEFISTGSARGIGWGLCEDITEARVVDERIVEPTAYHRVNELKNGAGPPPLKTKEGWLHVAHGVRATAAGLRYVLYAFLCDPEEPARVTHRPGAYLLAPRGEERVGDVSNVAFCNGALLRGDGSVLIYYASSDTRIHVATSTEERLLDFVINSPEDPGRSHGAVEQRRRLIESNRRCMEELGLD